MGTRISRLARAGLVGAIALTLQSSVLEAVADAQPTTPADRSIATAAEAPHPPAAVVQAEAPLHDASDAVLRLSATYPDGLAGMTGDAASSSVTVYWKGEPPRELVDLAAAQSARVELVSVQHSQRDLRAASQLVADRNTDGRLGLVTMSFPEDGSGLTVVATALTPELREAVAAATATTGVPFTLVHGSMPTTSPFASTR